jgi:hypothetical protein
LGLPDFLCIGAQKAGTSWLNNVLLEHPQVFMPPINELHFFDRLGEREAPLRKRQINLAQKTIKREEAKGDDADQAYISYLRHLISFPGTSLDWYKAAYSWPVADGVKKGDITPAYLEIDERHVRYARELLGPAKLILIVRRPQDRLLSQLRMWATRTTRSDIPQDEREWMDLFLDMTAKTTRGSYSRGVGLWRAQFGDENLLVLPYSDMKTDPRGMISRIEDHLGIERHEDYELLTEQIHVTKKLEVPPSVVAAAAALTAAEDDYIRREFGEEFFQKTK